MLSTHLIRLSFLMLSLPFCAFALTGLEVMQKVDQAGQGVQGTRSQVKMTLIDAHKRSVEREMKAYSLEDNKNGDHSLIEFIKPLDVRGTQLLTQTVKGDNNRQWLYLPQFKRVKKINSSGQSSSFMGSEFSFEDIAGRDIDKYSYKLLGEDQQNWIVESIPKRESGYTRLVSVISKKYLAPIEVKYFDRKNELLKTSELSAYKKYANSGKTFNLADRIEMKNVQTNKMSIMEWSEREIGKELPLGQFQPNRLK